MGQKYNGEVHVYKYPFEIVMARFPSCPQIPIFAGSNITYEFNTRDGTTSVINRECKLNIGLPTYLKKLAGVEFVLFNQKNTLNRSERTLLIEAKNITMATKVVISETCKYYVHPDNSEWTCFEQSATLDVKGMIFGTSCIEKLAITLYSANIKRGKEVLEYFIAELHKEGVTTRPLFTPAYIGPIDDEKFRKRSESGDNEPQP